MPRPKTIFRIVVTVALGIAYFAAPRFLKQKGETPGLGIVPAKVSAITITGMGSGESQLRRDDAGAWQILSHPGAEADPAMIARLLAGLAIAPCTRAVAGTIPADAPRVTLTQGRGRKTTIELGPRLVPLRRQLVRVDGRMLEIELDVSACLGFWERNVPPSVNQLLRNALVHVPAETIDTIRLRNPLVAYDLARTSETLQGSGDADGRPEALFKWQADAQHRAYGLDAYAVSRYADALSLVTIDRLAEDRELRYAEQMPYAVSFTTEAGKGYRFEVGSEFGQAGERLHLLQMLEPARGPVFVIGSVAFRKLVPDGGMLFSKMPQLRTGAAKRAIAVRYERNGRRCALQRGTDGKWVMTIPTLPYAIHTPPPEPGMPAESTADSYVEGLDLFHACQIFPVDSPTRRNIVDRALNQPAARALLVLQDNERVQLAISSPVAGTNMAFLSVNDQILVVPAATAMILAPDIKTFFDPQQVEGKEIAW